MRKPLLRERFFGSLTHIPFPGDIAHRGDTPVRLSRPCCGASFVFRRVQDGSGT
jgi:hypothetical protein